MKKTFEFQNRTGGPISICLEPWGEDFILEPGQVFHITHDSQKIGYVSTALENSCLFVYVEGDWGYPDLVAVDNHPVHCGYGRDHRDSDAWSMTIILHHR